MSEIDDRRRLRHMLEYSQEAIEVSCDKERADLEGDRVLNLAFVRLLELIGESASHVTALTRSRHAEIPWTSIIGLRNRLIHAYDSVDLDIVLEIARTDLPRLVDRLKKILDDSN